MTSNALKFSLPLSPLLKIQKKFAKKKGKSDLREEQHLEINAPIGQHDRQRVKSLKFKPEKKIRNFKEDFCEDHLEDNAEEV